MAEQPEAPGTIVVASSYEARYTDFLIALVNSGVLGLHLNWFRGANVADNFNRGIRDMQGEWVWLLGDDHSWDATLLPRLLQHEVDIVVPLVLKRGFPFLPVVYDSEYVEEFEGYHTLALHKLPTDGSLVEVMAAGTAGMLVRRRVIEAMSDPWFEIGRRSSTAMNEDTYFCEKARAAGFKVWLDTGAAMGHLTPVTITPRLGEEGFVVGFQVNNEFELIWNPREMMEAAEEQEPSDGDSTVS